MKWNQTFTALETKPKYNTKPSEKQTNRTVFFRLLLLRYGADLLMYVRIWAHKNRYKRVPLPWKTMRNKMSSTFIAFHACIYGYFASLIILMVSIQRLKSIYIVCKRLWIRRLQLRNGMSISISHSFSIESYTPYKCIKTPRKILICSTLFCCSSFFSWQKIKFSYFFCSFSLSLLFISSTTFYCFQAFSTNTHTHTHRIHAKCEWIYVMKQKFLFYYLSFSGFIARDFFAHNERVRVTAHTFLLKTSQVLKFRSLFELIKNNLQL